MATRYAVTNANGRYYKRSYDAFGGHWTDDKTKAATWATKAGANGKLVQQREYLSRLGRGAEAGHLSVVPVECA